MIATHEIGTVSEKAAQTLQRWSGNYTLAVVSNIWSASEQSKTYLVHRMGEDVFSAMVFSSDIGVNKPSKKIFDYALDLVKVAPQKVLMVGDDIDRDIIPAAMMGMRTLHVSPDNLAVGVKQSAAGITGNRSGRAIADLSLTAIDEIE